MRLAKERADHRVVAARLVDGEAADMIEFGGYDEALEDHLRHNHYPPVSPAFIPAAKKAIRLVDDGEYGEPVRLPNKKVLLAGDIVSQLHLEPFLAENRPDE